MVLVAAHKGLPSLALVVKNPPANGENVRERVWSLCQEDPLEEGIATHSSILAWRIPWTEETGGLQSMWVTKTWTRLKRLSTQHTRSSPCHVGSFLVAHGLSSCQIWAPEPAGSVLLQVGS